MTFPTNFPLPPTAGKGFTITGLNGGDYLGYSVAPAGDVNHDGIGDLIVGARGFSGSAGAVYIIFGSASLSASTTFALPPTAGTGFYIRGISGNDLLGYSVASAGDVNHDGIGDLIVGARGFSGSSDNGAAYVIFGSASLSASATFTLPPAAGTGFYIRGISGDDLLGTSVASAGDVNHDGIADFVVGAQGFSANNYAGAAYIIFGSSVLSASATFTLPPAAGKGFYVLGGSNDNLGNAVSSAGDVNGDGIVDVAVCAFGFSNYARKGAAYIIFGSSALSTSATFTLPPTVGKGFYITGISGDDYLGWSVAPAGDVNGDGMADLIVGAEGFSNYAFNGAAYIVFGSRSLSTSATFALPPTAGKGFYIKGISAGDQLGYSVASAGDVNGDGITDLVVGANKFSASAGKGVSYIIFGSAALSASATFTLPPAAGKGFTITGVNAGDLLGNSVASAGDMNHDGVGDLVVGAPGFSAGANKGAAYVIFGIGPCSAGTYSATGFTPCTASANGGFTNTQTGATTYTQCPVGYYNPGVGYGASYSVATACTPAPIGSCVSSFGSTAASICPAGFTTYIMAQTSCTLCVINPNAIEITSPGNYTGANYRDAFDINLTANTNVTLSGLNCPNSYIVYPSSGYRISITDFNKSSDVIDLTSFESITGFSDLTITQGSAIINLPASQKVIIQNLNPSDLNASNFVFGATPVLTPVPVPTATPPYIALPYGGSSESGVLGITLGITLGVTLGIAAVVGMSVLSLAASILGCGYTHKKSSYDASETFGPNFPADTIGNVAMILDHPH